MDGSCKASMFWNWFTTDACFISSQWRISSASTFTGFCIGVSGLVILLEFLRRMQREFIRFTQLNPAFQNNTTSESFPGYLSGLARSPPDDDPSLNETQTTCCDIDKSDGDATVSSSTPFLTKSFPFVPALLSDRRRHVRRALQIAAHLIRAAIYTCEFALAYTIMLLAMYYNGYIVICIFIGAFVGNFIWGWDLASGQGLVGVLDPRFGLEECLEQYSSARMRCWMRLAASRQQEDSWNCSIGETSTAPHGGVRGMDYMIDAENLKIQSPSDTSPMFGLAY